MKVDPVAMGSTVRERLEDLLTARGLVPAEDGHLVGLDSPHHKLFDAVIGASSPLLESKLKGAQFRSACRAAAEAIHRAG